MPERRQPTKLELWGGIATYCMTLQMLLALLVARPVNPVAKYMLMVIKLQFTIIVIKFIVFCFLSCWAVKIKEKGTADELRSFLYKTFLLSLAVFLGMYTLYMVQFVFYCTHEGDPENSEVEWDSIFCVKLLFWEILGIYNLMLVYGLFNYKYLKERSLSKLDESRKLVKEGGEAEVPSK